MKVYHGTTIEVARKALTEGLQPTSKTGVTSRWKKNPSCPERVYVTTCFAPYFAAISITKSESQQPAVIEIELSDIPRGLYYPDEDFLAYEVFHAPIFGDAAITEAKRHLDRYKNYWRLSLASTHTMSIKGIIEPKCISRIATWNPNLNPQLTIDLMKNDLVIKKQKAWFQFVTRTLFNGPDRVPSLFTHTAFKQRELLYSRD